MPTLPQQTSRFSERWQLVTWGPLLNTDDGVAFERTEMSDRSVQVTGTFGTGGTLVIEGSNDGTNWRTLNDPQGTALSFTVAGLRQVQELTRLLRPRVTAGDGTTNLVCTMILRKGNR